jgi:hypothetical protein
MAQGQAIVDMAAIVESASIAEPVARNDGAGMIHERMGQAPAALIEIACGPSIMPGVGDVTAMRQAADMPRLVAISDEIRDQSLEARGKMARNGDRPGCGCDGHHTSAMPRCLVRRVLAAMPFGSCLPVRTGPAVTAGVAGGVMTVGIVMGVVTVLTMPVTVTGLCRHGNGQKNGGRYEESHHNSLPLSFVMSGVLPEQARSPDAG